MLFQSSGTGLPISEIIPEIQRTLTTENTVIVAAPPGAGKSTLLPLALLNGPWLASKKIIMLEPRRLAARTIASRMASLLGEEVGHTVGYRIRFDNKISKNTRLEVVTEGILTRMMQSDNALEEVGMVIFDEFHERSLFADVALALCRDMQKILRPDLRMVIMSATLDTEKISTLLKAPVIESQGKQYPVEITYIGPSDLSILPESAARAALNAIKNDKGDILVFLPGEGEIHQCEEILRKKTQSISIHPLYGRLTPSQQMAAIMPRRDGKRKIVLATSIAETSLTIDGVSIVIDCGFGRNQRFDPGTGLSKLETTAISKDSADQRAGRAGRLGPGKCYRLWSLADHYRLASHRTPEISDADLSPLMLEMARWGVEDIYDLTWVTPPPQSHIVQASELLHQLKALDKGKMTPHGRHLADIPCHPRLAHMLIKARESNQLALATDIAALLEERDPMPKETGIDINIRIEALRRSRRSGTESKLWSKIERSAASYRRIFNIDADNEPFDALESGLLLVYAYPERIAGARPGTNARFQLANGSYAMASHTDDLAHEQWLAVAHLDARSGDGKIFLAAPLNPKDLLPMVEERENISWDTRKGGVVATRDLRIGSIVLQSKQIESPNQEKIIDALCAAIEKEGINLLNFSEEVVQWQNRVLSLRQWHPNNEWPDVSTTTLLKNCRHWLAPYLTQVKRNDDIKKINLMEVLQYSLPPDKQLALDMLAPQKIAVPSGSSIKIQYQPNAMAPVLAVRLQEMFGLADTPTVNNGSTPVLLHLLSPGFKPVQVTADLRSFWNNTYFEVRKELKNRYPKHVWPDDPWTEKAIRGVKRKK